MSKSRANPFGVLSDDAVEELSYNKKLAKQIVRSENAVVKAAETVKKVEKKPEEKKAEEKKAPKAAESKKDKAAAPAAAAAAAAPAAPAAAAPATEGKWETVAPAQTEKAAKPAVVRPTKVVDTVPAEGAAPKEPRVKLTIQRPGQDAPIRANKREHDRHASGTGRGKEQRKDGAGKANWGKETDPKENLAATEVVAEEKKVEEPKKEGETATEEPKKEEKELVEKSLAEFEKERKKLAKNVPKFSAAAKPAADVAEEGDWSNAQRIGEEEEKPAAKKAEKAAAPATDAKAAAAKKAQIKLNLVFYDDAERRQSRSRPQRDEPENARPHRDRPRPAPKAEAPKAAPAAAAPKAEDFPKLH